MIYLIAYFLVGFISMLMIRKHEKVRLPLFFWVLGVLAWPINILMYVEI